jgi:hypothetical protein
MLVADLVLMILNKKLSAEVGLDEIALTERAGSFRAQSFACYGASYYPSQMSAEPVSEPIVKTLTADYKVSEGSSSTTRTSGSGRL